jgi:hypothetical protein
VLATTFGSFFIVFILLPSNSRIISPASIPALSAGLFFPTLATKAPSGFFNFSTSAISLVTSWILTPNHPLFVSPNFINWSITFEAALDGIANPIPIDPDWPGAMIAVFSP